MRAARAPRELPPSSRCPRTWQGLPASRAALPRSRPRRTPPPSAAPTSDLRPSPPPPCTAASGCRLRCSAPLAPPRPSGLLDHPAHRLHPIRAALPRRPLASPALVLPSPLPRPPPPSRHRPPPPPPPCHLQSPPRPQRRLLAVVTCAPRELHRWRVCAARVLRRRRCVASPHLPIPALFWPAVPPVSPAAPLPCPPASRAQERVAVRPPRLCCCWWLQGRVPSRPVRETTRFLRLPPSSLWSPPSPRAGRGLCCPRICRLLHLLCCSFWSGAPACYTQHLLAHCCSLPLVSHHSWVALAVLPHCVRPLASPRVFGPLHDCLLPVLLLPSRASQLW